MNESDVALDRAFAALLEGWGRDDAFWRARIDDQTMLAHGIAGGWYLFQGSALDDQEKIRHGRKHLESAIRLFRRGRG